MSGSMAGPKRPAAEAIEAVLSEFVHERIDLRPGDPMPEDTATFWAIFRTCENLRFAVFSVALALSQQPEDKTAGFNDSKAIVKELDRLAAAGRIHPDFIGRMINAGSLFFWTGWHARGAAEEEDALRRLINTDGAKP